jgi:hypothetical protein
LTNTNKPTLIKRKILYAIVFILMIPMAKELSKEIENKFGIDSPEK